MPPRASTPSAAEIASQDAAWAALWARLLRPPEADEPCDGPAGDDALADGDDADAAT